MGKDVTICNSRRCSNVTKCGSSNCISHRCNGTTTGEFPYPRIQMHHLWRLVKLTVWFHRLPVRLEPLPVWKSILSSNISFLFLVIEPIAPPMYLGNKDNLKRHYHRHLIFSRFQCAICKQGFYRKDLTRRHIEKEHTHVFYADVPRFVIENT